LQSRLRIPSGSPGHRTSLKRQAWAAPGPQPSRSPRITTATPTTRTSRLSAISRVLEQLLRSPRQNRSRALSMPYRSPSFHLQVSKRLSDRPLVRRTLPRRLRPLAHKARGQQRYRAGSHDSALTSGEGLEQRRPRRRAVWHARGQSRDARACAEHHLPPVPVGTALREPSHHPEAVQHRRMRTTR
jgi:hypothetical protein